MRSGWWWLGAVFGKGRGEGGCVKNDIKIRKEKYEGGSGREKRFIISFCFCFFPSEQRRVEKRYRWRDILPT